MPHQPWIQIDPFRVLAFDQIDLPLSLVALQRCLPLYRCGHAFVGLEPDQSLETVLLRETCNFALAMLPYAFRQLACHTDIDRPVTAVCHHVDGDEDVVGVSGDHGQTGLYAIISSIAVPAKFSTS